MQTKRNGELDALRFVFMLMIVLLHFDTGIFPFGNIGVEFFYTLSGLLMARHAEKIAINGNLAGGSRPLNVVADDTWSFIKGKLRGFYKYYLSAFAFNVIVRYIFVLQKQ